MGDHPMLIAAAKAMDEADVGYSIRLTRLVDEVAEYIATIDGQEPRVFPSHSAASAWTSEFRRLAKARAVLLAIRDLTPDAGEAAYDVEVRGADLYDFCAHDCAQPVWSAIINHILGEG